MMMNDRIDNKKERERGGGEMCEEETNDKWTVIEGQVNQ